MDCGRIEDIVNKFARAYERRYEVTPTEKKRHYQWRAAIANQAWHISFSDALAAVDEFCRISREQASTCPFKRSWHPFEKSPQLVGSKKEQETTRATEAKVFRKQNVKADPGSEQERFAYELFSNQACAFVVNNSDPACGWKEDAGEAKSLSAINKTISVEEERFAQELLFNQAFTCKVKGPEPTSTSKEKAKANEATKDPSQVFTCSTELQHPVQPHLGRATDTLSDTKNIVGYNSEDHAREKSTPLPDSLLTGEPDAAKHNELAKGFLAQHEIAQTVQRFREGNYFKPPIRVSPDDGHLACDASPCQSETDRRETPQAVEDEGAFSDKTARSEELTSDRRQTCKEDGARQQLHVGGGLSSRSGESCEHEKDRTTSGPDTTPSMAPSEADEEAALEEISIRVHDICDHFADCNRSRLLEQLDNDLKIVSSKDTRGFLDAQAHELWPGCQTEVACKYLKSQKDIALDSEQEHVDKRNREAALGFCFLMMVFFVAIVQLREAKSRYDASQTLLHCLLALFELVVTGIVLGSTMWVACLPSIPGLLSAFQKCCGFGQLLAACYERPENTSFRNMVDECEGVAISFGQSVSVFVDLFTSLLAYQKDKHVQIYRDRALSLLTHSAKLANKACVVFEAIIATSWESHYNMFLDRFWECHGRFSKNRKSFRGSFHWKSFLKAILIMLIEFIDLVETTIDNIKVKMTAKLRTEIYEALKDDVAWKAEICEQIIRYDSIVTARSIEAAARKDVQIDEIAAKVPAPGQSEEPDHINRLGALVASLRSSPSSSSRTNSGTTSSSGRNRQDVRGRIENE